MKSRTNSQRVEEAGALPQPFAPTPTPNADSAAGDDVSKFQILVENLTQGIIVVGLPDWRPLYVNEAVARMYGHGSAAAMMRLETLAGIVHPEDRPPIKFHDEIFRSDEKRFFNEFRGVREDGLNIDIHNKVAPIEWDGEKALLVTSNDISERKRMEQALGEREQMLRGIFETASIGITANGRDGEYIQFNPAYHKMLGLSAEELSRKSFWDITHPEDHHLEQEKHEALLAGRISSYQIDKRYLHKNGSAIWVSLNVAALKDADGSAIGAIATVEDITERKLAEKKLQQAQKMEAVGQLTGGIAHDFNNLLAVIMGNLELIGERVGADDPFRDMVARGINAAERGAALTQRLLAFSRKQALQPTVIDLNKLVAGMTELLRRTLGERIDIRIKGQADPWRCIADRAQLENTLLNLSINARDAMPDGGRLTIETANIALNDDGAAVRAEVDPGNYVMLEVSDSGSGISKESLKHVFDPFFTTKEVGRGSGLGLSMVYGFAKQSGGSVTIASEPGKGTTVKLYLPRSNAQIDEAAPTRVNSTVPLAQAGERILVVEDDADVRTLTVALLGDLGYETADIDSAEAALNLMAHATPIDLLLSDVILAGAMNGPDLASEVRCNSPATKIVFMTGYAEHAFDKHDGVDKRRYVIQKPFKKADLARIIRQALDDQQPRWNPPAPFTLMQDRGK